MMDVNCDGIVKIPSFLIKISNTSLIGNGVPLVGIKACYHPKCGSQRLKFVLIKLQNKCRIKNKNIERNKIK